MGVWLGSLVDTVSHCAISPRMLVPLCLRGPRTPLPLHDAERVSTVFYSTARLLRQGGSAQYIRTCCIITLQVVRKRSSTYSGVESIAEAPIVVCFPHILCT